MNGSLCRFSGIILVLALAGCQWFNPEETLPIYLKLANGQVRAENPTGEIVGEQGLRDLWITHNGQRLGVYRTGRVIPLLPEDGRNELTIQGGIFENGLSGIRSIYPFWQPITLQIDAEPLDTFELDLTFDYYARDSIVIYPLEETFETGGSSAFTSSTNRPTSTSLNPTSQEVYQGDLSGRVQFSLDRYDFEAQSNTLFALPRSNDNDVYLEITHRNTVPFTVGMTFINLSRTNFLNLPTGVEFVSPDEWKTVYVHLQPLVQSISENGVFGIVLSASARDRSTGEVKPGDLFLDNIRLVSFAPI